VSECMSECVSEGVAERGSWVVRVGRRSGIMDMMDFMRRHRVKRQHHHRAVVDLTHSINAAEMAALERGEGRGVSECVSEGVSEGVRGGVHKGIHKGRGEGIHKNKGMGVSVGECVSEGVGVGSVCEVSSGSRSRVWERLRLRLLDCVSECVSDMRDMYMYWKQCKLPLVAVAVVAVILWMCVGTLFYALHDDLGWCLGFFHSLNIGWSVGWVLPPEYSYMYTHEHEDSDSEVSTVFSMVHTLVGVLFSGIVVVYIAKELGSGHKGWVLQMAGTGTGSHSLTQSLTHSHTHSLTHSLTHSHTHSLTHSLTRSLTQSL
jgi:hypothetical protein